MLHNKKKYTGLIFLLILFNVQPIFSGPPFDTDDPEPVSFKHWEYYISSVNTRQSDIWFGTAPHIELKKSTFPYGCRNRGESLPLMEELDTG
jgi:hypothetical protein